MVMLLLSGCGGGNSTYVSPPATALEWTWMGGSNMRAGAQSGVFGTEGVAAVGNLPGGRSFGATWVDKSGNFWLFGGGRVDPTGSLGPRNDLWEFSPTAKEWTWMGGSSTTPGNQMGIYGTMGTAAAANMPGGRTGAAAWTDSSGNLWMFGGNGFDANGNLGMLNDLWMYSPTMKMWTWMGGSNKVPALAVYGAMGTVAMTNQPGGRDLAAAWTDAGGNFWMLGGYGVDASTNVGYLNDLWMYSPTTKMWTWVGGRNSRNAPGVYGTQTMGANRNAPGARDAAATWVDGSGNLWLMGGVGYDSAGTLSQLNDLWAYSPSAGTWTWMNGASTVTATGTGESCMPGVYGQQGAAAGGNVPGGRSAAATWVDGVGQLWLFGGQGCDGTGITGELNDMWTYNPQTNKWTWMTGSSSVGSPQGLTGGPAGVYGTEGQMAVGNTPGGRDGAFAWADGGGNLWLFGGYGHDATDANGELNDLWEFTP